jgi:hypothetical protein
VSTSATTTTQTDPTLTATLPASPATRPTTT